MENTPNNNRSNRQNEQSSNYQNASYSRNQNQQYGQSSNSRGNNYADRQQQSYGEQNAGYNTSENRDSRTGNMNNNMYGSNSNTGNRSNSGYDQNRSGQNSYSESSSYSRPEGYQNNDYRNSGYRQDEYRTQNDTYNSSNRSYNQNMGADYDRTSRYNERYNRNEEANSYDDRRDSDRGFWDKASDEVSSWFGDDDAKRRRQIDESYHSNAHGDSYGGHRGKGPKSYQRSDDRIKEDVNDRLSDDHHIDASHVEVSISRGEITLTGYVDSKFAKRHAEDLAEAVSGVNNVENRIRVQGDSMTVSDMDNKDSKEGTVQTAGGTQSASTQNASAGTTNSSGKSKQVS